MGKSKKRLEMGEEAWKEYQAKRNKNKTSRWKSRNVRKVIDWRKRVKIKLIAYKGGKCELCGFNRPIPSCYDFHHLNPEEKDFSISGKTTNFEKLKIEADKCQLLCKTCHAIVHWEEWEKKHNNNYQDLGGIKIEKTCVICGTNFETCQTSQIACNIMCQLEHYLQCEEKYKSRKTSVV